MCLKYILTFNPISTNIHISPIAVSATRKCSIFSINFIHISIQFLASKEMPKSPFNCDDAIIIAAADVNPPVTGIDTNSTTNPTQEKQKKSIYMLFTLVCESKCTGRSKKVLYIVSLFYSYFSVDWRIECY